MLKELSQTREKNVKSGKIVVSTKHFRRSWPIPIITASMRLTDILGWWDEVHNNHINQLNKNSSANSGIRPCEDELDDTLLFTPYRQNIPSKFLLTDDDTLHVLTIHEDHNE